MIHVVYLVPVCFSFPNPKNTFWNHKCNICIWWKLKSNFLEKFVFSSCEENACSLNRAVRSLFQKLVCVKKSYRWTLGEVTKLPFTFYWKSNFTIDKSKNKLHAIPHSSHLSALPSALSITNFQIQTQKNL